MFKKTYWGSKTKKRKTALPVTSKVCSTCAFWAGSRQTNTIGFIEIHPYSKGECQRSRYKHLEMAALATCDKWAPWPVRNNYQDGHLARGVGY